VAESRWSLQRRLVALVLVLLAAAATVVGVASTLALRDSLLTDLDGDVVAASRRALTGPGAQLEGRGLQIGTLRVAAVGSQVGGIYITRRAELADLDPVAASAVLTRLARVGVPQTVTVEGLGRYRMVAQVAPGGVVVATGLPMEDVDATLARHVATTAGVTLLGLAALGLLGTALVRRELRPLARVAATASAVAATPLDRGEVALPARVPAADTDPDTEVGRVGAALNRMLTHVEDALAARHRSETQVRRFVADASHELRTPLASIRGYAELVRRVPGEVPPDVLAAMDRVESEARRMTTLVEDLLLLARLDAGRPLDRAPVDLAALAADAVRDAHAAAPDHRWLLEVPDGADRPSVVVGDGDALRQVLGNLLANARVHTPAGTTVTTTVRPPGGATPGTVAVAVRDDGPGFPPELADRLFDRFARGDAARSPGTGTGLGLAIADAIVRAHGGTITADGTPGATTFTVTLPVAGPAPTPPPAPPRPGS